MQTGKFICSRLPKSYVEALRTEAQYAGMERGFEDMIGYLFSALIPLAAINFLFLWLFVGAPLLLAAVVVVFIISAAFVNPYFLFTLMAEGRKKEIESVLPDILLLTSANIKSGMTIDRAILFSARPEFGTLSEHFKKAAFKIYGGAEVEETLLGMTRNLKSGIFARTIDLLVEGIKGGGSIAKLLQETAADIRNSEAIQREIKSTVTMYVMFLIIAGVLGAPILYAISTFMVTSISSMWGQQASGMDSSSLSAMGGGFIQFSSPAGLDTSMFSYFAIGALVITTFFAGIIISLIQTGNAKQGIKYVPVFVSASLAIYFAVKMLLAKVFGSLMGGA